jgi:hypothetical protein
VGSLTARIVPEARSADDELAGLNAVLLQFYLDGSPLDRSRRWSRGSELVSPGVAACLENLPGKAETVVLAVSSTPHHERRIFERTMRLRSEDLVYFDYITSGLVENFSWLNAGDERSRRSELVFELVEEILGPAVRLCFDWNSFRGYVLPRSKLQSSFDWPLSFRHADRKRRLEAEIATAEICFQDWADGCALRLYSRRPLEELMSRIRLDLINTALSHSRLDSEL